MKILFSPSEGKSYDSNNKCINQESFCFPNLYDKREYIINKYRVYIKNASDEELIKIFGLKDINECKNIQNIDLFYTPTCKAIHRYTGVAFKYLNFLSLKDNEKKYLLENLIIFSNLFGPIMAKDDIPYYKFKQGSKLNDFKPEVFYKENFSSVLDTFLENEFIIDLRAGFYEKFYTIRQAHISMKFVKNGKVISHWAKAYRGIIVKQLSKIQPKNIEEFENMTFPNLTKKEIIVKNHKKEYIFEIKSTS